jgi:MFS superfamily sulfate permease-like transporter
MMGSGIIPAITVAALLLMAVWNAQRGWREWTRLQKAAVALSFTIAYALIHMLADIRDAIIEGLG